VADCRQEGTCGTAYEAAIAAAYSIGAESFINTAAYQRVTSQEVTLAGTDKDLNPAMELSITVALASPPIFSPSAENSLAMSAVSFSTLFQAGATVGLIVTQIVAATSGVADFGLPMLAWPS